MVNSAPSAPESWLVGDIGATHARFGLVAPDAKLLHSRTLADEDYPTIEDALAAFLAERGALPMPRQGAIAIASAITGDRVAMTNHPWSFSVQELKARFAFERFEAINDFTALALALPRLAPEDRQAVGGGAAAAGAPLGVLGPGSGLGVSGLVPSGKGWIALTGEGGHATMAPATDREGAVLDRMRRHFDHVSAERALSGPGLVNLYNTLAVIDGVPAKGYTAAQITDLAIRAEDPLCVEFDDDVLRDARDDGGQPGADARGARRRLYRRWDRPEAWPDIPQFALSRTIRGERPLARLSQADPDLCGDPSAARISRLRCAARSVADYEARSARWSPATPSTIRPRHNSFQPPAVSPNQTIPIAATTAVPTPDHTA